jgi:hypothetical protein
LDLNSPFWRGESEKLNIGPDPLSPEPLLTRRDVWGAGYAELTVLPERLSSIGSHGLMLSGASAVEVVLRYVLREQSHCVPDDLTVKERLEGPFEMPYLSIWA